MKYQFIKKTFSFSLWKKFFICYTVPILFIILIVLINSALSYERKSLDTQLNYRHTLNNQIINSLESTSRTVQHQSYIIYEEAKNLEYLLHGPSSTDYFSTREDIKQTMSNFFLVTNQIDGFALFDLEGHTFFLYDKQSSYFTSHNSSEDEWYQKMSSLGRTPSYALITPLNFIGGSPLAITSGKNIYNSQTNEKIGIAIAFCYADTFFQNNYDAFFADEELIQLLDADGDILYSTVPEMTNFQLIEHHTDYDIVSCQNSSYIRTYATSSFYGWSIVSYTPYDSSLSIRTFIKNYSSVFAIVLVVFVSLIVSSMISLTVTKPLSQLTRSLKKLETGDFNAKVTVKGSDEVADIGHTYNQMLDKIQSLIKVQYELKLAKTQSELEALQSQINPHFLFNTLNSIKSVAYTGDSEKAAQMIQSLSDLMHYSLGQGKYIVSFAEEIATVQKYLYLQSIRFGSRYSSQYDIEDSIMNMEIPRLIIQPLVENSIKHGLEHMTENGLLIITAKLIDEHIYIYVVNNGSRIPQEKLNELNKKFSDFTTSTLFSHENIGLMNVCYRLYLHYPNNFSMEMNSTEKFTTTKLVIPANLYISKQTNECEETS